MVTKEITIKSLSGMESKQAAEFIQKASAYKASIWIEKGERKANAKSLLGLLALGIGNNTKVVIGAEGEDAAAAVEELEKYARIEFEDKSRL
ncbi:MAG: HPr family phosphocarrier protein [Clostridiales bacterium]|jgi:phosphotransferase system HPr (HPr) family protein|nr:HPr family phosphocarrier protein [Eubacteriales bacterium]MDH7566912.1 HPr family phosphocarrier protein [Clostridiales bacterium]